MAIPASLICSAILHLIFAHGGGRRVFATRVFMFNNSCPFTVWPATLSSNGDIVLGDGGFELPPDASSVSIQAPSGWSGRIWARTGCIFNNTEELISCATGDCSGELKCSGRGKTPVTLAEFKLANEDGGDGKDLYYVSLVDGYNIGIGVTAAVEGEESRTTTSCGFAGCVGNVNGRCPAELRVAGASGETVGCRSACEAFGGEQFCCTGTRSSPATCRPTRYSQLFKAECPAAFTYAYDNSTSVRSCGAGADYTITFCPAAAHLQSDPRLTHRT